MNHGNAMRRDMAKNAAPAVKTITMGRERWFDLRNEARGIADMFGVPEGWGTSITWALAEKPARAAAKDLIATITATHANGAAVSVALAADGSSLSTPRLLPDENMSAMIARLQRGQ